MRKGFTEEASHHEGVIASGAALQAKRGISREASRGCAQDPSLRLKNGSGQDDSQSNLVRIYSALFASPNKIIRIEILPKSNPPYGYDTASLSSVLPMQYSSGK